MAFNRQPKSVKVPDDIREWLKAHREGFDVEADFNRDVELTREVTTRIIESGTCSPFSLKILNRIYKKKTAATAA